MFHTSPIVRDAEISLPLSRAVCLFGSCLELLRRLIEKDSTLELTKPRYIRTQSRG